MVVLIWKEKYIIGVEQIDNQHKELFEKVSDFIMAVRLYGRWEDKISKVTETLGFLERYVIEHFRDEDIYQKQVCYPGFEKHSALHKKFADDMVSFKQRFEEEKSETLMLGFAGKLLAWLINHVAAEDQKIAAHVNGNRGKI